MLFSNSGLRFSSMASLPRTKGCFSLKGTPCHNQLYCLHYISGICITCIILYNNLNCLHNIKKSVYRVRSR